jgi:hypothetical protein
MDNGGMNDMGSMMNNESLRNKIIINKNKLNKNK